MTNRMLSMRHELPIQTHQNAPALTPGILPLRLIVDLLCLVHQLDLFLKFQVVPEFVNEKPAWLLLIIFLNESYGTSVPTLWQFLRILFLEVFYTLHCAGLARAVIVHQKMEISISPLGNSHNGHFVPKNGFRHFTL